MSKLFKVNVSAGIFKENQILIQQRSKDEEKFPGLWGIPGGTVEMSDATLEVALAREIKEEVGEVQIANLCFISNNIRAKEMHGVIYLVYTADYVSGTPEALDGTDQVKWISLQDLSNYEFTPTTKELIETAYARKKPGNSV